MTSLSFSINENCREDKNCILECLYYCLLDFKKKKKKVSFPLKNKEIVKSMSICM